MRLRTSLKDVAKMNLKGAKVAELHVDELANRNPKVARLHVYQPMRGGGPHESKSRWWADEVSEKIVEGVHKLDLVEL